MEFKKALYPSDFSFESVLCAKSAIDYCKKNNIELFFLHTYRLIKPNNHVNDINTSFKRELESNSIEAFKEIETKYLSNADIKYHFRSEVGFVLDRIAYNSRNDKIDVLIICDSIYQQIKSKIVINEDNVSYLFDKPILRISI